MAGIELVLDIKNKINSALGKADAQVDKWRSDAQRKLDNLKFPTVPNGKLPEFPKLSADTMKAVDALRTEIPLLDRSMDLAGNKALMVGAGLLTVGAGLAYATSLAYDWEKGMAVVNTTASRDLKAMGWSLDDLSGKLKSIGRDAPVDIMEVPLAFNKIISSGLDVNTSLAALKPTLLASKAGFTDLETTAKAMAQTMGGTGIKDATKVYDVLFATQRKGNVGFQEVAQFFPKLISGSKTLGLSFEQTAGSWAFLTTKMSAEQSTTGLQNLTKALADGKIQKAFKANKVQIFDKDGNVNNMLDIVKQVKDKTKGLSDKGRTKFMDALGLDMEATSAMSAMISDVDYLKSSIDAVKNSGGSLNQAFLDAATTMDLIYPLTNAIKIEMMSWGSSILDLVKPPLLWMTTHLDSVVLPVIKSITAGILGGAVAWGVWNLKLLQGIPALLTNISLSGILLGIWGLIQAINPFGWIAIGIAGFSLLWMKFDKFRFFVMGSFEAIKSIGNDIWQNMKTVFSGIMGMAQAAGKLIAGVAMGNVTMIKQGADEFKTAWNGMQTIDSYDIGKRATGNFKTGYVNRIKSEAQQKLDDAKQTEIDKKAEEDKLKPKGNGADYNPSGKDRASGAQEAISSSTKTINITVNGGLVSGGIEINVTELSKDMGWAQIEDRIGEVIMKTIRNVEVNY
jgi:TP901 family phage tail tape measure protein